MRGARHEDIVIGIADRVAAKRLNDIVEWLADNLQPML